MADPYQILGVERGVSDADLEKAYKKLAKQYHPDLNPGDAVKAEKFKEINAARDAIKSGVANQPSGFTGHPGQQGQAWHFNFGGGHGPDVFHGFNNLDDILQAMHAQAQRRNRDVHVECHISLEEAFRGTDMTVNLREGNHDRTINVKIPAGVDNGNRIRVAGAGEKNFGNMPAGDLFVNVHIRQHQTFTRQGKNLLVAADLDIFDILVGGTGSIVGIDGATLEVKIPANFNPNTQLRLAGQGMPVLNTDTRGDIIITVRPSYPALSEDQMELIRQARALTNR